MPFDERIHNDATKAHCIGHVEDIRGRVVYDSAIVKSCALAGIKAHPMAWDAGAGGGADLCGGVHPT